MATFEKTKKNTKYIWWRAGKRLLKDWWMEENNCSLIMKYIQKFKIVKSLHQIYKFKQSFPILGSTSLSQMHVSRSIQSRLWQYPERRRSPERVCVCVWVCVWMLVCGCWWFWVWVCGCMCLCNGECVGMWWCVCVCVWEREREKWRETTVQLIYWDIRIECSAKFSFFHW